MGKTTLLLEVLKKIEGTAKTVFLFQTLATPVDLLRALLQDLGRDSLQDDLFGLQGQLNTELKNLWAAGKRLVLVVDEAQNLDLTVLEALRMLSNFETGQNKLMQIILSGQPELSEKLRLPELLQLRQRISLFPHLEPLTDSETQGYIHHRLIVAGMDPGTTLFSPQAVALISAFSQGIPRNINNLCFNALSLGCALQRRVLDQGVIVEVGADLGYIPKADEPAEQHLRLRSKAIRDASAGKNYGRPARSWFLNLALAATAFAALCVIGWLRIHEHQQISPVKVVQATATATTSDAFGPTRSAPTQGNAPSPHSHLVLVRRGQTLYEICIRSFGKCNAEQLNTLIEMNPSIHDPNLIGQGQRIKIPDLSFTASNAKPVSGS
jgi:general secretion pathway protein A